MQQFNMQQAMEQAMARALREGKRAPKVIRVFGDLKRATVEGKTFEKQTHIVVPKMGMFKCVDYGNHFIFYDDRQVWPILCTCGGPSGIVNPGTLIYGMTPGSTPMLACLVHAGGMGTGVPGKHADGSS